MSILTLNGLERIHAEALLKESGILKIDEEISRYEWTAAKKHAKYPGAGVPIPREPQFFRQRMDEQAVIQFMEWLNANHYLQDTSFGHKVIKYCNGAYTTIEAVKLTSNISQIIKDYIKDGERHYDSSDDEEELRQENVVEGNDYHDALTTTDEEEEDVFFGQPHSSRCNARCKRSGSRCLKNDGHSGRHSFTQNGRLSPSSIEKILRQLTDGKIRSLAGLDDIDSEMGRENFIAMKGTIENLASVARDNALDGLPLLEVTSLLEEVDSVEAFHKCGYAQHLVQGKIKTSHIFHIIIIMYLPFSSSHLYTTPDDCTHICTCLKCGFSDPNKDPIPCIHRSNGTHIGQCKDCWKSFNLFSRIFALHSQVDDALRTKNVYESNKILEDDMQSWVQNIQDQLRNFLHYRGHIAQAEDEAAWDQNFYSEIDADECIVVFDFKMKILASFFREKQKDWFSKRGFSCLGVMLIFGRKKDEDHADCVDNEVLYHMFFSDDTTQDFVYVNTVKE